MVTPGQKHKLQSVRSGEFSVEFPLRLMYKDLLNVERLAGERAVPTPAIAAARQMFAVAQAKDHEEDFSAIIHTMEELAGVHVFRPVDRQPANQNALPVAGLSR